MNALNYRRLAGLALLVPAAVCAIGFASPAQAALVTLTGGSSVTTSASGATTNNVLGAGYVIQDNALLSTTVANVQFRFYFLGSESGFANTLQTPWGNHTESDSYPGTWPGAYLFGGTQAAVGALNMSFSSTGSGAPAGNLTNGGGDSSRSIAFAYLNPLCLTAGTMVGKSGCVSNTEILSNGIGYILFALDDSGANRDDNHDDYVGYMTYQVVPIPAAVWLLGSGLIGLVGLSRRRVFPTSAVA